MTWTNVGTGSYTLTAKAFDILGVQAQIDSPVNIAVGSAGNTPPTVSLTAPADGASFTTPVDITLSAAPNRLRDFRPRLWAGD